MRNSPFWQVFRFAAPALAAAAKAAVQARTLNSGQSCIAAKRFIAAEPAADGFERRLVRGMEALEVGDPTDETTDVEPLASAEILETLERQVRQSVEAGARLLTGGFRLDRPGSFYAPTVLTDIPRESPAYREELFGPVAALFRARDLDEALRVADDTVFGLGVWMRESAGRRLAETE